MTGAGTGRIRGKALLVGDNVDTDQIMPGRFLAISDEKELGKHVFDGYEERVRQGIGPGTILVAGQNFGCGSSREHAPVGLRGAGVEAIVAKGFARIFLRNAINLGIPVVVSAEAAALAHDGSQVEISLGEGIVSVDGKQCPVEPFPQFLQDLLQAGGLRQYVQRRLRSGASGRLRP
jgi:3-isopropylmalate/(R)-2-methylmalate dehydratase small subunit